ncbi:methionyl-tRNA formyltransferase [Oleispirillum naphthae]|uniref:methionyl-tRNA formyltransferase n=1 Tax=Oleispirillum naphthae TaxID=2838853 RepID=UPI0030824C8F
MTSLRAVFIGCVHSSLAMLEELLTVPGLEICGVVTRQASTVNADFTDLSPLARANGIPVFHAEGSGQDEMAAWIRDRGADICFCLGWSYLLNPAVLAAAPRGVVGYHPALLPRNRGRHPLIWALVLGLTETGSTFFLMDAGADSGPILSQERIPIADDDDAGILYGKMIATARAQVRQLALGLCAGTAAAVPQDASRASNWRKRGRADGQIDWRMPASGIHNLVRALAPPYPGAHALFRGAEVKVWKTRLGPGGPADVEPGCVLGVAGNDIRVQCGEGTLILERHEFGPGLRPGDYL